MSNILAMTIFIIISLLIVILTRIKISLTYTKKGNEIKGCLKVIILGKIKIYSINIHFNEQNQTKKYKKTIDLKKLLKLVKPCLNDLIHYIISILKKIKIKKIQNHIIFGRQNFADTGKDIGIIWATLAMINPIDKNIKITAEPSFTGSMLDGYGVNEVEINILRILHPTIKLLLKKNVQNLIKGVIDERKN